jgi:hypothetical protein
MININDIMGAEKSPNIPVEKLDLFIDRCKNEKGYSLPILGNEINTYIRSPGMFKIGEIEIYQAVLQRIQQRHGGGER